MSPLTRLVRELRQLRGMLSPADFTRYLYAVAVQFPAIARERSLVPADRQMLRTIACSVTGGTIRVPVGEMTRLLEGRDPTPTFGAIREMYASNVYLAPFGPRLRASNVIDLGSNRGLFAVLTAVALKAHTVVGVEPSAAFESVFKTLLGANDMLGDGIHRITAFAASTPGQHKVTVEEIMGRYGMDKVGFLKCDIEGAEFDVFLRNNDFLERVDAIAMEVHPTHGDPAHLRQAIEDHGLHAWATDQFGRNCGMDQCHYLFAKRWREVSRDDSSRCWSADNAEDN